MLMPYKVWSDLADFHSYTYYICYIGVIEKYKNFYYICYMLIKDKHSLLLLKSNRNLYI